MNGREIHVDQAHNFITAFIFFFHVFGEAVHNSAHMPHHGQKMTLFSSLHNKDSKVWSSGLVASAFTH